MPSSEPFDVGLLSPATVGPDELVSDGAVLRALVEVEVALLQVLAEAGIAPESAAAALAELNPLELDVASIAIRGQGGGNPVIPLLADLRALVGPDAAPFVHRGATSQDVLDTALMLVSARARTAITADLDAAVDSLATLAAAHRTTVMAGRTLTQHSTPISFGAKVAGWLSGVLDARDRLSAATVPAQLAGASGNLASFVELSDAATAAGLPASLAHKLALDEPLHPWHTSRAAVTTLGDALVAVTDALGAIASTVALLARPEIAELAEPLEQGRGGSSAMPQKQNPVMSVLIRSTSLRAPLLAAQLHVASANAIDERPDGAWHTEWPALRELLRLALGASTLVAELLAGLQVDTARMRANLELTGDDILAERKSLSGVTGDPADYLGTSAAIIDSAIARATQAKATS